MDCNISLGYSKRINCFYMLEQCAIKFKIPLNPPFLKGEILYSPLWKRGVRGDLIHCHDLLPRPIATTLRSSTNYVDKPT